jgi:hypothetical protein
MPSEVLKGARVPKGLGIASTSGHELRGMNLRECVKIIIRIRIRINNKNACRTS